MIRKIVRNENDQETYFISLNDFLVGLLFIFIVLLMTYSLIFQDSVDQLNKQLNERMELRTALLKRIQVKLEKGGYQAEVVANEGVLRLPEGVLFEPGQARLGQRAQGALSIIAGELAAELPCFGARRNNSTCPSSSGPILEAVYVEGHTDDLPINTAQFRSNWELSSARSIATYNYLIDVERTLSKLPNASGTATLLGASAYADTRPVAKVANPAAGHRQKNRRVDFRFLLSPPSDQEVQAAAETAAQ